jgi:hypothetical protein
VEKPIEVDLVNPTEALAARADGAAEAKLGLEFAAL